MSAAPMSDEVLEHNIWSFFQALMRAYEHRGQEVPEDRWQSATWELLDQAAAAGVPPSRMWQLIDKVTINEKRSD